MKLNEQSKNELRKEIEEAVKRVPEGQRIHLDKELLDDLLFTTLTVNKELGIVAKIPVWSGKFLRKIDLSEVSFENVSWQALGQLVDLFMIPGIVIDKSFREQIQKLKKQNDDYVVDYSYTNANIDLTKSVEALNSNQIYINACNLERVNLKSQDLSNIKYLRLVDTNISNTNLKIPNNVSILALDCDFSNNDLTAININGNDYVDGAAIGLGGCCLMNTGIRIKFDISKYKKLVNVFDKQSFIDNWRGCYLNGKIINRIEDSNFIKQQKKEEYENMKKEIFDTTLSNIEGQIKKFGGK